MKRCLCFHAEALHDDRVWQRLQVILRMMAKRGSFATFFVYPLRAIVNSKDICDRIKTLADLGHEIGQHTHFYSGTAIQGPHKTNDFREHNIRECIQRDYEWLCQVAEPKGFTAGGWVAMESLYDTLINFRFMYDCSARIPALSRGNRPPLTLWLEKVQVHRNSAGSISIFPTTHTVRDSLLHSRDRFVTLNSQYNYQLIYLHDYDLLRWSLWTYLACRIATGSLLLPVRALHEAIGKLPNAT
jgi:hypothetical protein